MGKEDYMEDAFLPNEMIEPDLSIIDRLARLEAEMSMQGKRISHNASIIDRVDRKVKKILHGKLR